MKKIIFLGLIVLLIVVGGFFWWQGNQKDVKELNKKLPEGIRVVKSFLGEYKVINKIDGYGFKVPKEWRGLAEVEYNQEREVKDVGARLTSMGLEGKSGYARILSVDVYTLVQPNLDLEQWSNELWDLFELEGVLTRDNVGDLTVIKAFEEKNLGGTYVYFFKKDQKVYVFNNGSEDFIREIITNGKW